MLSFLLANASGASLLHCLIIYLCRSQPIRVAIPQAEPEHVYDIKYYSKPEILYVFKLLSKGVHAMKTLSLQEHSI